ncbi:hypothetical protein D3C71_2184840 [compost metagenome]
MLTQTWRHSSPEAASVHAASTTASGAGSTRLDSQPSCDAACHTPISSTGTIHGAMACALMVGTEMRFD